MVANPEIMLKSSSFVRLYCFGVEPAAFTDLRLHGDLQGLWREHPCPSADDAGYVDRSRVSPLWRASLLFASGYFPRPVVAPVARKEAGEIRAEFSLMGEMRRAIARDEEERRKQDRFASTLVISASIIAAVRLARDDISRPSPRVQSVIVDSVQLARSILNAIVR